MDLLEGKYLFYLLSFLLFVTQIRTTIHANNPALGHSNIQISPDILLAVCCHPVTGCGQGGIRSKLQLLRFLISIFNNFPSSGQRRVWCWQSQHALFDAKYSKYSKYFRFVTNWRTHDGGAGRWRRKYLSAACELVLQKVPSEGS